jgi:hypothetical protein
MRQLGSNSHAGIHIHSVMVYNIVMLIKIKSKINAPQRNHSPAPDTPLRSALGQSTSSNSGLKNLSEQRDRKKMKKQSSVDRGTINKN